MHCTLTQHASQPFHINQCNGKANGKADGYGSWLRKRHRTTRANQRERWCLGAWDTNLGPKGKANACHQSNTCANRYRVASSRSTRTAKQSTTQAKTAQAQQKHRHYVHKNGTVRRHSSALRRQIAAKSPEYRLPCKCYLTTDNRPHHADAHPPLII